MKYPFNESITHEILTQAVYVKEQNPFQRVLCIPLALVGIVLLPVFIIIDMGMGIHKTLQ